VNESKHTPWMKLIDTEVKQIVTSLPQSYIDWGTKLIGSEKAWAQDLTAKGIKTGILDTGIDYNHPDLMQNIKKTRSFIDGSDGFDSGFHGTHVAGIATGRNNGIGIIGVAPESEIYSAKIFRADGTNTSTAEFAALEWLAGEGVHVINMSYGGFIPTDIPEAALFLEKYHSLIKEVAKAGVIMVAAAGNWGNSHDTYDRIGWPARFPEVFAVGAISQELQRADFSSTGPDLDFAMPGVDVYSCYPGGKWARYSGTSMAAPYLTGCIGLLQEYAIKTTGKPLSYEQVKKQLIKYAQDLGMEGIDEEYGYGIVNIGKIGTTTMDNVTVTLDRPMDIINGRTAAPLRFIVEVNGGQIISWNNVTKTVVFRTTQGKIVTMQAGNPVVTIG
jgi:subtilisin family serine protease